MRNKPIHDYTLRFDLAISQPYPIYMHWSPFLHNISTLFLHNNLMTDASALGSNQGLNILTLQYNQL